MRPALVVLACLLSLPAQGQSLPFLAAHAGASLPEFDNTTAPAPDLVCSPAKPPAASKPSRAAAPAAVLEWPDSQEVAAALREAREARQAHESPEAGLASDAARTPRRGASLSPARPGWRIAVWGDSHMAAGHFTDEIARLLAPGTATGFDFLSAGLGHPGVRQPVRRACLTGDWVREHAHAHAGAAQAPAPGLSTLVARQPGATLSLDVRDAHGQARARQWEVLHDGAGGATVGVRVDGGPEAVLTLGPSSGAQRLAVRARAPIATLSLRVIEGSWRLQGLQRTDSADGAGATGSQAEALRIDQFGFPGATVAGWARADLAYLGHWFQGQRYDLVVLAFGTNEANDPHFQEDAYRLQLARAVGQWRQLQPQAQCVLVSPGDRGVRVARVASRAGGKPAARSGARAAAPAPKADLLRYARLHALVSRIQAEVAASAGCAAWSMQDAMGGLGSAYHWARQQPPLMAPDLIHFTRAGYRELAASFVADTGLLPR